MEWKLRRRDVPERMEPSLSDGASAEEEGLDRFEIILGNITKTTSVIQLYVSGYTVKQQCSWHLQIRPPVYVLGFNRIEGDGTSTEVMLIPDYLCKSVKEIYSGVKILYTFCFGANWEVVAGQGVECFGTVGACCAGG